MKKVTVVLALILLVSLVVGSVYFILQGGKGLTQVADKVIPTITQQTALSLTPQNLTAQPDQPATIQVMVQNNKSTPKIVQLELAYDPSVLSNVTITPGAYFSQPKILFSRINGTTGRISYILEANAEGQINTAAPVASISFIPSMFATVPETKLSFLPKSVVKDQNNLNILNGMYGATITIAIDNNPAPVEPLITPMTTMPAMQGTPALLSPTTIPAL